MRKFTLALLPLFFLSLTAWAQLEKGNKVLGGSFNYSSVTDKSKAYGNVESTNVFQFNPSFGYFVKDNLVVGLGLGFYGSKSTEDNGIVVDYSNNSFGVGPYIQKFFPLSEKFSFFGRISTGYTKGKDETSSSSEYFTDSEFKFSTLQVNSALGFTFFPKKWLGIDLSICPLKYSHLVTKPENSTDDNRYTTNVFNFSLDTSSILLGANFYLSRK